MFTLNIFTWRFTLKALSWLKLDLWDAGEYMQIIVFQMNKKHFLDNPNLYSNCLNISTQDKIGIEGETDPAKQSDQWQCYWFYWFKMCHVFTVAQKRAAEGRAAELQAVMKQGYSGLWEVMTS